MRVGDRIGSPRQRSSPATTGSIRSTGFPTSFVLGAVAQYASIGADADGKD